MKNLAKPFLILLVSLLLGFGPEGWADNIYDLNPDSAMDIDRDGLLNPQDPDRDGDGIENAKDRLPFVTNSVYCEPYRSGEICLYDNCPGVFNLRQLDTDRDGVGDPCDSAPTIYNPRYDHDCDGKITSGSPQEVNFVDENFVEFFSETPCANLPKSQASAAGAGSQGGGAPQQDEKEEAAPSSPPPPESPVPTTPSSGFNNNRFVMRNRVPAPAVSSGGSSSEGCMHLAGAVTTSRGLWEIVCGPWTLIFLFLILIRLSLPSRKRRPGKNFSRSGR